MEERSDDALCRAPAVPGILPRGKIVEGEKAAGVYEGAEPPVLTKIAGQACYFCTPARNRGKSGPVFWRANVSNTLKTVTY